jgi:shikimate dehydrogenase
MRPIDTETRLCAVIGNPVEHSLSPLIHNAAFDATGLNYVYLAFRIEDLRGCLAGMRALPSFRGLSVTIPHKIAIMQYLDEIDPMAVDVGSVNTVVNEEGKLLGMTTDGLGILRAFDEAGVSLEGKRVLFVGAGGAVRAVAFALAGLAGPAQITILGRTESRVSALVRDLATKTGAAVEGGSLSRDLPGAIESHEIIIQGTPVGMYPHGEAETTIPKELLHPNQVVFDMVYRPLKTRLIRAAEEVGCRTIPGLEMLVNQAVLQFEAWTGVSAPRGVMRDALIAALTHGEDASPAD